MCVVVVVVVVVVVESGPSFFSFSFFFLSFSFSFSFSLPPQIICRVSIPPAHCSYIRVRKQQRRRRRRLGTPGNVSLSVRPRSNATSLPKSKPAECSFIFRGRGGLTASLPSVPAGACPPPPQTPHVHAPIRCPPSWMDGGHTDHSGSHPSNGALRNLNSFRASIDGRWKLDRTGPATGRTDGRTDADALLSFRPSVRPHVDRVHVRALSRGHRVLSVRPDRQAEPHAGVCGEIAISLSPPTPLLAS